MSSSQSHDCICKLAEKSYCFSFYQKQNALPWPEITYCACNILVVILQAHDTIYKSKLFSSTRCFLHEEAASHQQKARSFMLHVFITEEGSTTYTSTSVTGKVGIASLPQLSHHCLATLFSQKASSVHPRALH